MDDEQQWSVSALRQRWETSASLRPPIMRPPINRSRSGSSPQSPSVVLPISPSLRTSASQTSLKRAVGMDATSSRSSAGEIGASSSTSPATTPELLHDQPPVPPDESRPTTNRTRLPPPIPAPRKLSATPTYFNRSGTSERVGEEERQPHASAPASFSMPASPASSQPPSRRTSGIPNIDSRPSPLASPAPASSIGAPPPRATPRSSLTAANDSPAPKLKPVPPPPRRSSPAPSISTSAPPTLPARPSSLHTAEDVSPMSASPSAHRPAPPHPRRPSSPPRPLARAMPIIPPRPPSLTVSGERPVIASRPVPPPPAGHRRYSNAALLSASAPISPMSSNEALRPPPARRVTVAADPELVLPSRPASLLSNGASAEDSDEDGEEDAAEDAPPDSTFASRRPPTLEPNDLSIHSKSTISCAVVRGDMVVIASGSSLKMHHLRNPAIDRQIHLQTEAKVTAMAFRAGAPMQEARYVWAGMRDGAVIEVDLLESRITTVAQKQHTHSVSHIFSIGAAAAEGRATMVTIDENGKAQIWQATAEGDVPSLSSVPRAQRITMDRDRTVTVALLQGASKTEIWVAGHQANSSSPLIRVYSPCVSGQFSLTSRPVSAPDRFGRLGAVAGITVLESQPDEAIVAHDNGRLSIWSRESYSCLRVVDIGHQHVSSICAVGYTLWTGFKTGRVRVYDTRTQPWIVLKDWAAHTDRVLAVFVDPTSLWTHSNLHLITYGHDQVVHLWDAFCKLDWIDKKVSQRESEYCAYRPLRILVCSWNVDAQRPAALMGDSNPNLLQEALHSLGEGVTPDIIVFGYQELIDLEDKRKTAKSMLLGGKKDTMFSDKVSHAYRLWHEHLVRTVSASMPSDTPYRLVHAENLVGLFTVVFVKTSECTRLRDIALSTVKTGLGGRYGNKGAILARMVIDDSSICFVNAHLAAGQSHRKQRNKDLVEILEAKPTFVDARTTAVDAYVGGGDGTMVSDHDIVFLSGDLNFRIDLRRDAVLALAQADDFEPLRAQDQLLKEMKLSNSRLRYFKEGELAFRPTYKYDKGSDRYDSSEKNRIPAWCDRVLWRTNQLDKVQQLHYRRYESTVSDHRPISAGFEVRIKSIIPAQRAAVVHDAEAEWPKVHEQRLELGKQHYGSL